jgi:uncharacterized protein
MYFPARRFLLVLFLALLCVGTGAGFLWQQSTVHVPEATLESYVGQYRDSLEPDNPISVFRDHDHLYVESARLAQEELKAQSATVFLSPSGRTQFTFVTATHGAVTGMQLAGTTTEDLDKISSTPVPNHFRAYSREEVMIPMRDGVKLHAVILRPEHTDENLPFLMERTPYGVSWAASDAINAANPDLAQSGYIFVFEDIRGRFGSEGTFVMMRPLADHRDPKAVDESTDTYDTVAWLLTHVPHNNGRVGVAGISYPGFLAAEAGIDPHPAVRAISPQAPMTDVWLGDDFFHNGAFRETYGYDYVFGMESNKGVTPSNITEDEYTWFLRAGSFAGAMKASGAGTFPTWQAFQEHPAYDSFWSSRAVQDHENAVTVPTLEVGGWWDQEDLWGPQAEYAALEPHNQPGDPAHRVYMVLGPWRHGSWASTERHLGPLNFGEAAGDEFRQNIEAPFFAYYLKDQTNFTLRNTATYQTGSDRWMFYSQWPPKNATEHDLYLGADGTASFAKPADPQAYKAYRSDPANPVPYRERPVQATYADGSRWFTWLVQDQRLADGRPDVATFETVPLNHDVTVTGNVVADLIASTSGTDSDWVVKLIDVFPENAAAGPAQSLQCGKTCLRIDPAAQTWSKVNPNGYELMIADEVFRGRYRTSFEHPEAIPANTPEEYKFSLHAADHVFLKGHRIMVQVQSTWFPLYDRNPQTYVPNIMTAQPADYQAAEQRVYAGSHIVLAIGGGWPP